MAYDKDNQRLYTYPDAQTGEKVGITTSEIYKILRYNKRDKNGNRQVALAIKNGNINKWAKYKPIEVDKTSKIDEQDRFNANQGFAVTWIQISGATIPPQLFNELVNRGLTWDYIRPSTWFRMLDFDGYDHIDTLTPFQVSTNLGMDGIGRVTNDTYESGYNYMFCNFHQWASQIQPKDMALFASAENKANYDYKMAVMVLSPSSRVEIYYLYNSIADAKADNMSNAVEMPLEVSGETFRQTYFKMPNSNVGSGYLWKAMLICVRVNKTTQDKAWIPLPTQQVYSTSILNPTADIEVYWAINRADMKPLRITRQAQSGNVIPITGVYMTHILVGLNKYVTNQNINFDIRYEWAMPTGNRNQQPIDLQGYIDSAGTGDLKEYTYRTNVLTSPVVPLMNANWENLIVYMSTSLKNGDADDETIYYDLANMNWQGNYLRIPPANGVRGYSLKAIMDKFDELGLSQYYEIVQE